MDLRESITSGLDVLSLIGFAVGSSFTVFGALDGQFNALTTGVAVVAGSAILFAGSWLISWQSKR